MGKDLSDVEEGMAKKGEEERREASTSILTQTGNGWMKGRKQFYLPAWKKKNRTHGVVEKAGRGFER